MAVPPLNLSLQTMATSESDATSGSSGFTGNKTFSFGSPDGVASWPVFSNGGEIVKTAAIGGWVALVAVLAVLVGFLAWLFNR